MVVAVVVAVKGAVIATTVAVAFVVAVLVVVVVNVKEASHNRHGTISMEATKGWLPLITRVSETASVDPRGG